MKSCWSPSCAGRITRHVTHAMPPRHDDVYFPEPRLPPASAMEHHHAPRHHEKKRRSLRAMRRSLTNSRATLHPGPCRPTPHFPRMRAEDAAPILPIATRRRCQEVSSYIKAIAHMSYRASLSHRPDMTCRRGLSPLGANATRMQEASSRHRCIIITRATLAAVATQEH